MMDFYSYFLSIAIDAIAYFQFSSNDFKTDRTIEMEIFCALNGPHRVIESICILAEIDYPMAGIISVKIEMHMNLNE